MKKKLVMAVGGTGGHIYPAIALADQLKLENPHLDILFIGGKLEQNRYFEQGKYPYKSTHCGSLSRNPVKLIQAGFNILKGAWDSRKILREFKPDLMVGFGSYHSFPALAAASQSNVPFILHESNSIPGKVNRLLSSYADVTGILFPSAASKLKGKTELVHMPLRAGYRKGSASEEEALRYFNLTSGKPTLLIFGGSQGAQALNQLAAEGLEGDFQVIHIAGNKVHLEIIKQAYIKKGIQACVKEFESRMDLAWQAANIALCRAGAGTIAEAIEFEVPCLLVPYPHAADDHQRGNADFFCETIKGGISHSEKDLTPFILNQRIHILYDQLYSELKSSLKKYKQNQSRKSFSHLIAEHLQL